MSTIRQYINNFVIKTKSIDSPRINPSKAQNQPPATQTPQQSVQTGTITNIKVNKAKYISQPHKQNQVIQIEGDWTSFEKKTTSNNNQKHLYDIIGSNQNKQSERKGNFQKNKTGNQKNIPRKSPIPIPRNFQPSNIVSNKYSKKNIYNWHKNMWINSFHKSNFGENNTTFNKTKTTTNDRSLSPIIRKNNETNKLSPNIVKPKYISKSPVITKNSLHNWFKNFHINKSSIVSNCNNNNSNINKKAQTKKNNKITNIHTLKENTSNVNTLKNKQKKQQVVVSGDMDIEVEDIQNSKTISDNNNNNNTNISSKYNNNMNNEENNPTFMHPNHCVQQSEMLGHYDIDKKMDCVASNGDDEENMRKGEYDNKRKNNKNKVEESKDQETNDNGRTGKPNNNRSQSVDIVPLLKQEQSNSKSNNEYVNNMIQKPKKHNKIIKKIRDEFTFTHVGFDGEADKENNQDAYFICRNFAGNKHHIYMSVCDGHGVEGHYVSGFIKRVLPYDMSNNLKHNDILKDTQIVHEIITETFWLANDKLIDNEEINSTFSGTTCVSLIYTPERLITANIGDSRAVLGRYENNEWISEDLTRDHKPTEQDEAKRIYENDGRIQPFIEEGEFIGPQRVWVKEDELPGLAMTRSFGDRVAATVGVISEPEIKEYTFKESDKFFIIASDGVFEFINSQECVKIISGFYLKNDIKGCCEYLYKESKRRWWEEEEVIDDITMILVFLD